MGVTGGYSVTVCPVRRDKISLVLLSQLKMTLPAVGKPDRRKKLQ